MNVQESDVAFFNMRIFATCNNKRSNLYGRAFNQIKDALQGNIIVAGFSELSKGSNAKDIAVLGSQLLKGKIKAITFSTRRTINEGIERIGIVWNESFICIGAGVAYRIGDTKREQWTVHYERFSKDLDMDLPPDASADKQAVPFVVGKVKAIWRVYGFAHTAISGSQTNDAPSKIFNGFDAIKTKISEINPNDEIEFVFGGDWNRSISYLSQSNNTRFTSSWIPCAALGVRTYKSTSRSRRCIDYWFVSRNVQQRMGQLNDKCDVYYEPGGEDASYNSGGSDHALITFKTDEQ